MDRATIWLGPASSDSSIAIRVLDRLQARASVPMAQRLWSRKEGNALLALAERPAWKQLHRKTTLRSRDPCIAVGITRIPWGAILHLRDELVNLEAHGRLEHQACARALLASAASQAIEIFLQDSHQCNDQEATYPPALAPSDPSVGPHVALNELSRQLDTSIANVESRWTLVGFHL